MKTTTREPHAPLAVLPELDEFLRPFHVHFSRSEGRQSLERYLTGLLTEHNNKHCDTIAQVVPGTNQQRLHTLLTGIAFDQDNPNFLAGLELRKERYVVAVRCDFSVALGQFAPAQRADALIATQGKRRWQTVRWREGSKGWLRAKVVALRCWRVTSDGKRRIG